MIKDRKIRMSFMLAPHSPIYFIMKFMSSITLLLLEEITLYFSPTLQLNFDNFLPAISLIIILSLTSVVSKLFHSQPLEH